MAHIIRVGGLPEVDCGTCRVPTRSRASSRAVGADRASGRGDPSRQLRLESEEAEEGLAAAAADGQLRQESMELDWPFSSLSSLSPTPSISDITESMIAIPPPPPRASTMQRYEREGSDGKGGLERSRTSGIGHEGGAGRDFADGGSRGEESEGGSRGYHSDHSAADHTGRSPAPASDPAAQIVPAVLLITVAAQGVGKRVETAEGRRTSRAAPCRVSISSVESDNSGKDTPSFIKKVRQQWEAGSEARTPSTLGNGVVRDLKRRLEAAKEGGVRPEEKDETSPNFSDFPHPRRQDCSG
ncbi:hypothetical protein EV426DRAFT_646518 [Tirmania nivea]|nr:hypothetical protein EV426DRAFT_646518 [Tirmania nivea]